MKYKGNKKLFYVITYDLWAKKYQVPLGDTALLNDNPPTISKELSPQKIYHFKILQELRLSFRNSIKD